MEEVDRVGVAAVFTANADRQHRIGAAALVHGDADQPADADPVERLERRDVEDPGLQVGREERALDVVAAEAPDRLGQIVGAEGEEVRDAPIGPAVSAARGSSIMVPIGMCSASPVSSATSAMTRSSSRRVMSSSSTVATSGTMISGCTS